jgi:hypothetical protein
MKASIRRFSYQVNYVIAHLDTKSLQVFGICVCIAAFLWVFNALRKERTEVVAYPIEFEFNKQKYIPLKSLPTEIPVAMKGSGWQLLRKMFRLRIKPITLSLSPEYQMKFPFILKTDLTKETEKVLRNVRLESIQIDSLSMQMDYRYKRVLKLSVDSLRLNVPKGYKIVSPIKIYPELVAVEGPKKMLKALPNPLDMSQVKIKGVLFQENLPIQIQEVPAHLLQKDEKKVFISFEMARFVSKNITAQLLIESGGRKRTFPINLHYTVRESEAAKVHIADFVLEADWTDYHKKDGTVAIKIKNKPAQVLKEDIFFIKRLKIE